MNPTAPLSVEPERYFDICDNFRKQKEVLMKRIFKRILSIGLRKNKRHKAKDDVYVRLEKSFRKNLIKHHSIEMS